MTLSLHTMITSLITDPETGGKYIGYLMSDDGLARVVVPLALTPLYEIDHRNPFIVECGLSVIGLILSIILYFISRHIKEIKKKFNSINYV